MKTFLFFALLLAFNPQQTLAVSPSLVINQIQVEGDGGSNDEFIQLYNPSSNPVSINGWSMQYKSSSGEFPLTSGKKNLPDATMPPQGFYLIARTGYNGVVAADHAHSSFSLSAASSGATVFLSSSTVFLTSGSDPAIIDKVAYGASTTNSPEGTAALVPPSEQVIKRSVDTDNNAADFTITAPDLKNSASTPSSPPAGGPTPTPSPTPTPVPAPAPSVRVEPTYSSMIKISELMVNPDGSDDGEEWVELFSGDTTEVDLSGWVLDDESLDGAIGSSAFTIPSGVTVKPAGFLIVNLPEEAFSLNNTGGDTLRLLWPNKKLATSVAYSQKAEEDETYALRLDNRYVWTKNVTKGLANKFSHIDEDLPTGFSSSELGIKINEVFPNPSGKDSGKEWVEIKNEGTGIVTLHDWIFDDGEIGSPIGSNAWKIQSPTLKPGDVVVMFIPAGRFSLNNTGSETLRVFNSNKTLIDALSYTQAQEDLSYSKVDGEWVWTSPTPGQTNVTAQTESGPPEELQDEPEKVELVPQPTNYNIIINEVFPEPEKSSEEFIELFNPEIVSVNLAGWMLADNVGKWTIKQGIIDPQGFLVIEKSASKLALNNSGPEIVKLFDPAGRLVSELEFEDSPKNQSFNRYYDDYVWSTVVSPGKANTIKTAGATTAAASKPKVIYKDVPSLQDDALELEPVAETEQIAPLTQAQAAQAQVAGSFVENKNRMFRPKDLLWLALAFVMMFVFWYIYYVIKKKGMSI